MTSYSIQQVSGILISTATILHAGIMLDFAEPVDHYNHPIQPPYRIEETSKTFSQLANFFTGEFDTSTSNFEFSVSSFYADLLSKQEPLGEEFEKVLYDNLWNLYVRT